MFGAKGAVPFGDFVALSPTNACPLKCRHCISHSGPNGANGGRLFTENLDRFFSENPFQTSRVSLTGGEPLLDLGQARGLLDMLSSKSIQCVVVTSAYWAKTIESAHRVLSQLDGLSGITISYDPYHAEFVKPQFIQNAYVAAKRQGVPVQIRLVRSFPPTREDKDILSAITIFAHEDDLEIQRLTNYGRARNTLETAGNSSPVMTFCPSTGPHISHDGTVTPCCSSIISIEKEHPLQLGNVFNDEPMRVSERFRQSVLLLALKTEGRSYFQKALLQRGINVDDMQICDLCYEVCSNSDLWEDLKINLFCPEEIFRLYSNAVVAFGFTEFQQQASEAAKAVLLAELERRRGNILNRV